jgi:hypothetical protein
MDNNHDVKGEVGYKKPPRDRRFKKGTSGNPKGRPKGAKNYSGILQKELNARISITENGKHRLVTKQEALVKGTVNTALRGDHKATALIFSDLRAREDQIAGSGSPAPSMTISQDDELVMESIVRRIRASDPALAEPPAPKSQPISSESEGKSNDIAR